MGRPLYELDDLEQVPASALLHVREEGVAELFPGHPPHNQTRYLWTDEPPGVAEFEFQTLPVPPVRMVAVRDVELRSDWMPYKKGGAIVSEQIHPSYVRRFYVEGHIDLFGYPEATRARRVRRPVFVVSHFNMRTYGHFLYEVLPKLLLVKRLHASGWRFPIAFPKSQPAYTAIVRRICPEVPILGYDDGREKLLLSLALMPSQMTSETGQLHDSFTAGVKALRDDLALRGQAGPPRVFLSRKGWESFRTLANEDELAAIAAEFGFVRLLPQQLAWEEQVRLFAGATHVLGEVSSALHGTLFCRPSAKVIGLNWAAGIQSGLAAAAGHEIGYLRAKGGVITTFRPGWTETQPFEIDAETFRRRLEQIA